MASFDVANNISARPELEVGGVTLGLAAAAAMAAGGVNAATTTRNSKGGGKGGGRVARGRGGGRAAKDQSVDVADRSADVTDQSTDVADRYVAAKGDGSVGSLDALQELLRSDE